MLELISAGRKLGWLHALAAEKEFFTHLSENDSDGEGGHREECRALQDRSQNASEFRIADWIRRHGVDRPGERFV